MALIETHFFSSELMLNVTCNVIIPQRKKQDAIEGEKFKTLWLLHGFGDDESMWLRRTSIERYAAKYGIAVVMPCVFTSAYADMAHGGAYYSFITKELPQVMSTFFTISQRREDNFIAGLSMGGAGALKIGLANPDLFSAIGCLSAGAYNHNPKNDGSPEREKRKIMLYGNRILKGTEEDVFGQADKLLESGKPLPRIYHCIGNDDFLLESALETKNYFQALPNNPFDYTYEQDEGAHNWEYWDEHIKHFLNFVGLEAQQGIIY